MSLPYTVLDFWTTQCAAGSLPSGWGADGGLGALQQLLIEKNQLTGSLPSQWGSSGEHAAGSVFTPNAQHAGFSKTLHFGQGRQRHLEIRPLCGNLQPLHLVWCGVTSGGVPARQSTIASATDILLCRGIWQPDAAGCVRQRHPGLPSHLLGCQWRLSISAGPVSNSLSVW